MNMQTDLFKIQSWVTESTIESKLMLDHCFALLFHLQHQGSGSGGKSD